MTDINRLRDKLHACLVPSKQGSTGFFTVGDTPNLDVEEILYLLRLIPEKDPNEAMKAAHVRLRAAEKKVFGVPRSKEADERLRETMAEIDKLMGGGIR